MPSPISPSTSARAATRPVTWFDREMQVVCDTANQLGLPVAVHAGTGARLQAGHRLRGTKRRARVGADQLCRRSRPLRAAEGSPQPPWGTSAPSSAPAPGSPHTLGWAPDDRIRVAPGSASLQGLDLLGATV